MIIERDVVDTIQITLSTLILSLVMVSDNAEFEGNQLIIVGLTLTIIISFSHLIFQQLQIINPQISKGFSISTVVTSLIATIGYIDYDLVDTDGFWDNLGISYNNLFAVSILLLLVSSVLNLYSKQVKSDMIWYNLSNSPRIEWKIDKSN